MTIITLATLAQATEQEIFDQVAVHLLKQMKASYKDGNCAYRGDNGMMCAAGCLISDDEFVQLNKHSNVNNLSWLSLIERRGISQVHYELITDLQKIHDGVIPESWYKHLTSLAIEMELNTDKITEFKPA